MGLRGLAGKVAVIVGGASGLGSVAARRLGREGCRVIVGDIAADAAEDTAGAINTVSDPDAATRVVETWCLLGLSLFTGLFVLLA